MSDEQDISKLSNEEFRRQEEGVKQRLKAERERREELDLDEQRAENMALLQELLGSDILKFIRHTRTSCSDKHPINFYDEGRGYARCNKCHLLEILENDDPNFKISFDVNITPIRPRI